MSIVRTFDVFCDACGNWFHGPTNTQSRRPAAEARQRARASGWSCTVKGDFCPDHRPDRPTEGADRG